MKGLIYVVLPLSVVASWMAQQSKPEDFVIDGTKPYVYIKFDHIAPRKPVLDGENPKGIWLKLVNNCTIPIKVTARDLGTGDPGVALDYTIVSSAAEGPNLLSGREPVHGTPPASEAKPPRGYSFDVGSPATIHPGRDLLFSIPADHVTPAWFLQVSFGFVLSKTASGRQPSSVVDFSWGDIPAQFQAQLRR
jgi:hypothetical protein